MPIVLGRKKSKPETLLKTFPEASIIDVTSRAKDRFVRLSPFYPHGNIPVPEWPGKTAMSVEGIWQGLKVFEGYPTDARRGPDFSKFETTTMSQIKRQERKGKKVLGHLCADGKILSYLEARKRIYLPAYRYVLEHFLSDELNEIRALSEQNTVVLLDYSLNGDVSDLSAPLSHAALVKAWIEGRWPEN
ncbi:MAG: hypothetical protein RMM53_01955 [Bacteroidia bacterium]|nr:hypothetical protein [Bacteroidia bacterium]MDW8332958.1 hypothetical protein [Bacteroidia bacterium]